MPFSYESQINLNLQQLHVYIYIYIYVAVYTMRFVHQAIGKKMVTHAYIRRSVKKHASVSSLFSRALLFASRVCCTDRFGTTVSSVCTSLVLLHRLI
jgi:hypothetical protein